MSQAWNQLVARRFTSPRLLLRVAVASFVLALCLSGSAEAGAPARATPPPSAARRVEHADIPLELREAIEKSRYRIRDQERATRAPGYRCANPGQDFEATFSGAGLDVKPGGVSVGPGAWRMSLRGYGYGERMQPVAAAEVTVRDNRIEYQRGPLTEWYVNERRGLEQGFTLSAPPQGHASGEPLVLRLGVSGALHAVLQADGEQVAFVDAEGERVLSYSKLAAFDARGRRLPARMRLVRDEVRLEVDERGAAYPVTIDPLIATEQAKLTASDAAADDQFGSSVALSGDTALVGAPWDDTAAGTDAGSAYVFVRSGTSWSEQAKLTASDAAANDFFGLRVALSGDTALVGAPYHDTAAVADAGSAYVFVRSGTTWSEQAKLTASDAVAGDFFGWSVALSGDTALVGALYGDTAAVADAGSAYVFVRGGTTWSEQAKLTASDPAAYDEFGYSVALSGDTALVGSPADATAAGRFAGSAYVFVCSGTTWSEQAKLTASDAVADDDFGYSVALSGDTAIVAAFFFSDTAAGRYTGSAYVFVRSGTTWSEQAKLTASDPAAYDDFGYLVALSGDTALIGSPNHDTAAGANAGSAYVFVRSGTTWSERAKLTASDAAADDTFGASVALSGDTAIVGAYRDDTAAGMDSGSAYVYALVFSSDSCAQVNLGDYNLFVLGDYSRGTDVAGKVAAGGNITLNNFSVGHGLPANDISNALVAGGNLTLSNGGVWGEAHYAGSYSANTTVVCPRGAASRGSPIDFTSRGQQLRALSTQLGSLPSNGTTTVTSWGGLMLRGTNAQLNVFQVKASDLSKTVLLSIEAPGGSLAVLNITGTTATLRGGHEFSGGIDEQGVLFNFVEATAITASGYGLSGTMLAPGARVDFSNGNFDGGIYALSMSGNAAGHIHPLRSGRFCQ